MADGSPQTKSRELDHLYGDADWTEPAADFWANSSSVVFDVPSAAEVEAAERALEAAAQSYVFSNSESVLILFEF